MNEIEQKPQLDARLVNPFILAVTQGVEAFAKTKVALKDVLVEKHYRPAGDISGVIEIAGDVGEGLVALSFPQALATAIVSKLLKLEPKKLSAEARNEKIGELVQKIYEQVKPEKHAHEVLDA